jgi:hypothetical protein
MEKIVEIVSCSGVDSRPTHVEMTESPLGRNRWFLGRVAPLASHPPRSTKGARAAAEGARMRRCGSLLAHPRRPPRLRPRAVAPPRPPCKPSRPASRGSWSRGRSRDHPPQRGPPPARWRRELASRRLRAAVSMPLREGACIPGRHVASPPRRAIAVSLYCRWSPARTTVPVSAASCARLGPSEPPRPPLCSPVHAMRSPRLACQSY